MRRGLGLLSVHFYIISKFSRLAVCSNGIMTSEGTKNDHSNEIHW